MVANKQICLNKIQEDGISAVLGLNIENPQGLLQFQKNKVGGSSNQHQPLTKLFPGIL
jgi:hypothetical protein